MKRNLYAILSIVLISFSACDTLIVDTDSGTRIEVVVTVDGEPANGVHAFLYEGSSECSNDDTGVAAIQEAISTDDDAIFGELEEEKTYYVKVQTGELTSSCKSITTKLDEKVTINFNL